MASGRIVVFGATGYTGELTARALLARGIRPVLAARSRTRVEALADQLGGLDHAVADADRPVTLATLVGPGDVLISTVGPFARWGAPVVQAAIAAGAHYVDSTGEPAFIRRVFQEWGPDAARAEAVLLTAMGHDFVPGNLAAALALADAGPAATQVEVGYFVTGSDSGPLGLSAASGGTRASLAGALLEPSLVFRSGRLVAESAGRHLHRFMLDGRGHAAISIGGSEHFTLPALHPQLTDVRVFLGWAGPVPRAAQLAAYSLGAALAVPGARRGAEFAVSRLVRGSTGGPDADARAGTRSLVLAEARDAAGRFLAGARLRGANPYDITAALLAWAAQRTAEGQLTGTGALGPVQAFGLEPLLEGAAEAGLAPAPVPQP